MICIKMQRISAIVNMEEGKIKDKVEGRKNVRMLENTVFVRVQR